MQTWMVWTVVPITKESLRRFFEDLGSNETGADEAIVHDGDARVYVSSADVHDEDNVLREDVAFATTHMGAEPASMLSMRIGHAPGSEKLAERVVARALETWGGFFDRNEV